MLQCKVLAQHRAYAAKDQRVATVAHVCNMTYPHVHAA